MILLVRHCQSSGPAPDDPLTAQGFAQAERLAELLRPYSPDAVYSSPYLRTRQSVAPLGLPVTLDPRLVERRLAFRPLEAWREAVRRGFEDPDHAEAGDEPARRVVERGQAAMSAREARGALRGRTAPCMTERSPASRSVREACAT